MALKIESLIKSFNSFKLGPLDHEFNHGLNVITGNIGSGKTTLLNMISGLVKPDDGSIFFHNSLLNNILPENRQIGYLFQNNALFPHLTVFDNVAFGIPSWKEGNSVNLVSTILDDFGLSNLADRQIFNLSGGETKKVSLARTLISDPKLLLLDEPLVHLDLSNKLDLISKIKLILDTRKIPILLVTHYPSDVYSISDSILSINTGKFVSNYDSIPTSVNHSNLLPQMFGSLNLIHGVVIESSAGISVIRSNNLLIKVLGKCEIGSNVVVAINSNEILISKSQINNSHFNMVQAKILRVLNQTPLAEIHVANGDFCLIARIDHSFLKNTRLVENEEVYISFQSTLFES